MRNRNAIPLLLSCLVLATGNAPQADPICGDLLWEQMPCEFCGRDAYVTTGIPEMNHDCVLNIVDFGFFAEDYCSPPAPGKGGDLDGNGIVDAADFMLFGEVFICDYGAEVPDCEACNVVPDSCAGVIRVSFSPDPGIDLDRLDLPPGQPAQAWIVAEECPGMSVHLLGISSSENVEILDAVFHGELDLGFGTSYHIDPEDHGPHQLAHITFMALDPSPGWIRATPCEDPAWDLAWAQLPPGRRMGYELIAAGGVGADPPPDSLGCPGPLPPVCGDLVWEVEPCEFCGQDAYGVTGVPDMTHDCFVDEIDLALFYQEYGAAGPGLSGDFSGDQVVDIIDFGILVDGWNHGVPDCDACSTAVTGCGGTVRVSFSPDLTDVDRIDLPVGYPAQAYIVAEGCLDLAAVHMLVYVTPNITYDVSFPTSITIQEESIPYGPPFDEGPNLLATVVFQIMDSGPGVIGVTGSAPGGPGALRWIEIGTPRRMAFETIASGGINGNPLPDEDGCAVLDIEERPPEPRLPVVIRTAPNPATHEVRIAFTLPWPASGEVLACDPAGRVVRWLRRGLLGPGDIHLAWDGRDEGGSAVPAGAYFIRLRAAGIDAASRMIWLR